MNYISLNAQKHFELFWRKLIYTCKLFEDNAHTITWLRMIVLVYQTEQESPAKSSPPEDVHTKF